MIYGMYVSTMGAMVQTSRHANIANNLANANTTGYKPDYTVFRQVDAESEIQGSYRGEIDEILEKTGGGVWLDETPSNFAPGVLRETGNPLDMALDDADDPSSRKFFMIRKREGGPVHYTRDGQFRVNGAGELVNLSGDRVLSADGGVIDLPQGTRVRVGRDGTLFDQNNVELAQVGVVRTGDPSKLRKIGENLFLPQEEGAVAFQPAQIGVIGGTIEDSTTNSIREMTAMIEAHRTYETNMKFISIQDETLASTVQRVASLA